MMLGFDENKTISNILAAESGLILCEVNCQGVMGALFTKQVKRLYPEVFAEYVEICKRVPDTTLLGRVQVIPSRNPNLYFVCAFGQLEYGRNEDTLYLDYEAFEKSLREVNQLFAGQEIMVSNNIGCEKTSNGDWSKVREILQRTLTDCKCFYSIDEY